MVPTMGALHAGHRALIDRAVRENDRVVVTIFVNPAQFGPNEDFSRYPRSLEADLDMVDAGRGARRLRPERRARCIRRARSSESTSRDRSGETLEGASRPGHFDGVALVVVEAPRGRRARPSVLRAEGCPAERRGAPSRPRTWTWRSTSSSVRRFGTLTDWRSRAEMSISAKRIGCGPARFPSSLSAALRRFDAGEYKTAALKSNVRAVLDAAGLDVDYVAVVEPDGFTEVETAVPTCQIVVAARIGSTRLIDVVRLGVDTAPVGRGV